MAEEKKKEEKKTDLEILLGEITAIKKNKKLDDKLKPKLVVGKINAFLKKIDSDPNIEEESDKMKKKLEVLRAIDSKSRDTFIGNPIKEFLLVNEKFNENVEPAYFWILGFLRDDLGLKNIDKITDTYTASEASAFAKSTGQSLSAVQDRVTAHMKSMTLLIKELFQYVREMKVLDEQLGLFEEGEKAGNVAENAAEITLKGRYIDLVEGGAQSPSSVYNLASKVGFALLPDLFFRTHIFDPEKVGAEVDKLNFNKKVKEVLSRKLRAYAGWRKVTKKTLEQRRKFSLGYLKVFYNNLKMNVQWVKPYLKTIKRLTKKPGGEDMPDIIAAIEQALLEIEILAKGKPIGKYIPVTDIHFSFRTHPEMSYDQRMSQYRPSHSGRIDVKFMSRVMTAEQLEAYKISKEMEDLELMGSIDKSVQDAMDALGDDLKKYLEEIGEKYKKEEKKEEPKKKKEKMPSVLEPFANVFKGLNELSGGLFSFAKFKPKGEKPTTEWQMGRDYKEAAAKATKSTFLVYWVYKKAHLMITW